MMLTCYVFYLAFCSCVLACHREEEFVKVAQDGLPLINPLKIVTASWKAFCSTECIGDDACKSFVYLKQKSTENCLLSGNPEGERSDEGGETYKRQSSTSKVCLQSNCPTDRTCTEACHEPFYLCSCQKWRDGMFCENFNVAHLGSTPWRVIPGVSINLDCGTVLWSLSPPVGEIWFWQNSDSIKINGLLSQISSGNSGLWGVNKFGQIYTRLGVTEASPAGTSWLRIPGFLTQITSGELGVVYGVGWSSRLYCRLGISAGLPQGDAWRQVPGTNFIYIACGKFGCWAIMADNTILFRTGVTAGSPDGVAWEVVDGLLKQLDVGPHGEVCGLDLAGKLWCRVGITEENPTGKYWSRVENVVFKHISIGESNLFGLAPDGTINAMP